MKRKILKMIALLAILAIILLVVHTALVLHPSVLFEYETEMAGYTVLTDEPIPPQMEDTIRQAHLLIAQSEIYDPEARGRIILSRDHVYNTLTGQAELAYATHRNAVLAGDIDPAENSLTWEKSRVKMDLVSTLAHELVHCLQGHHQGFVATHITDRPPMWKQEGYAEYVAQRDIREATGYDLRQSIHTLVNYRGNKRIPGWITTKDGFDRPVPYYRSRLLVEYLLDIEGLAYADFMRDQYQDDVVYEKMTSWYSGL